MALVDPGRLSDVEIVILIQSATIVALVVTVLRQQNKLFNAAMSRTPGEYRKLEAKPRVEAPKPPDQVDEAAAMVIASMAGDLPVPTMPHGLGGE